MKVLGFAVFFLGVGVRGLRRPPGGAGIRFPNGEGERPTPASERRISVRGEQSSVAVAVATLDRPNALARCIDAILAGSMLPRELIVVDQGENDDVLDVLSGRRCRETKIMHLRSERRGLSASRNLALRTATAAVVAVTDDDCVPDPEWVATIAGAFASSVSIAAVSGRVLPLGPEAPGCFAVSSRTTTVGREFSGHHAPWKVGTGANFAVRRQVVEQVGLYDERLGAGTAGAAGEDLDMLYRLLRSGACIRYDPDAVVYHERQTAARRWATRTQYGRGIGACCALWLRRFDLYALAILASWLSMRGRLLGAALLHRRWRAAAEEILMLKGTAQGFFYGLTIHDSRSSA